MKTKAYILAMILAGTALGGCAALTKRANLRAESHVKYHSSKQLNCNPKALTATCIEERKSGECVSFEVVGCDASIVYSNGSGSGWTSGT